MTIVTDPFKKLVAENLLTDFNTGNHYFVGLGRSQLWNDSDIVVVETNSARDRSQFRQNLQGVKQIADISAVVPRFNWSSGTIYSGWDDAQVGLPTNAYYIITSLNQVYLCVQPGRSLSGAAVTSVVEPTGTSTTLIKTADGYIWKYLYTLSSLEASRFLAANWMPVRYIDSATNVIEQLQEDVQNAARPGQVSRIIITNGGTGYTTAPSVVIQGDGDSATAQAIVFGGAVVRIQMDSNGSGQIRGQGYNEANVVLSGGGGSGATARAVLSPKAGFGADPRDDLKSTAIMLNGRPSDTEAGALLINQDFRQVGLMRNVKKFATDSDFVGGAGSTLSRLVFSPGATAFTSDNIVIGSTSGARGYIDFADSATGLLYHQTEVTGFKKFQIGEALTAQNLSGSPVVGSAVLNNITPPLINKYSGEVLYLDHRGAIVRSSGETQDIKIVIQL
jgi:hypothetical protein